MHVSGGSGSIGHRCPFDEKEARKQILRTHTTAVSARMLYQLANREGGFKPAKYFSVDRVFRNETMDSTHLCEFHQVEGLVADYGLDLGKWTEIGNSGIFRPEMLAPMGLPEGVRVIAWGLSLERPTMIKYRIANIRDLFGHKADLARTAAAPICTFP